MNTKTISIVALSLAVLSAGVSACIISINRADAARSRAEASENAATQAEQERKTAQANADAENAKRRTAEAESQAAAEKRISDTELEKKAQADARTAEANRKTAEAEAEKARAESETARARSAEAKQNAEAQREARLKAEAEAHAALAKSQEAAAKRETEKIKSEKVISEAKLLELRKTDFQTWQQQLSDWQRDLEEREAALTPEKTIANLNWAGGNEDTVIDEKGNVVKQTKKVYDPEKDATLSLGTRNLLREERLAREADAQAATNVRARVVKPLEELYVQALKEGRVIDAAFYKKTLKTLYPDWEYGK